MSTIIRAIVSIAIFGLCAWIFDVELQTMLLFSIAFDLTILRIKTEDEKNEEDNVQ